MTQSVFRGTICYRKLRTAADRERIRPLPTDALPKRAIDQEQRLRDTVWNGDINGLTTREIAAMFDLERQRTHHVLYYILAGKSADNRFSKPVGSNYHEWRVSISEGRIFTREPVPGPPHNEYRWFIVEGQ
ncbi:hypothetical protein [Reticulibacter mediterranei]|uniref:hypothetical protein n=1 Tax=Reticulibacter mediterranei TaxID=2778369 RepID=UPI001C6939CD|nr:hypothetical protein [Reticulibacter mediterranei]